MFKSFERCNTKRNFDLFKSTDHDNGNFSGTLNHSRDQMAQGRPAITALRIVFILAIFLCSQFGAPAEAGLTKTVTPSISIEQQYDDNIDLEPDNEDSDWITLVSPGISLGLEGPDTSLILEYMAGFSFYRDDTDRNSTRHNARTELDQRLSSHLKLQLSDSFVRSEDPISETKGEIEDIRRERSVYYQNSGQVSLSYEFGEEDVLTAGYRNSYFDDRSSDDEDSKGHEGFFSLDKWFAPQFGIGLTSLYNHGKFEQEEDFDHYEGGLTANYRWQPARRLYARYNFLYHDFEEPETGAQKEDYRVHQGALGISLAFGPNVDVNLEGGYFLQHYLDGNEMEGGSFNGSLNARLDKASFRLETGGGYDEDYFTSENLGSSEYRRVLGTADYQLTETIRVFGAASYRWEEFFGADITPERRDEVWRGSGGVSLSFWRWLTLSLEATHSVRESTDPDSEFRDNRFMLRLTGAYPLTF